MKNHYTDSNAFGETLRKYRREKRLTQMELGKKVNVVHSFICSLESGAKQPSFEMVLRLALALEVKPGEFVDAITERMSQEKEIHC